ncbi:MAG: glycosyltransferase, partial [Comamonadaceae bacterium]
MQKPELSVVISVQNRSAMLMDCFRGLGAQTLAKDRFEVVVIDNCSSENLQLVMDEARASLGLNIRGARTAQDRGPAPARCVRRGCSGPGWRG